jgi:hypothetical protein
MNAREGVVFPLDACAHHVGTGAAPIGSRRSAPAAAVKLVAALLMWVLADPGAARMEGISVYAALRVRFAWSAALWLVF